MPIAEAKKYTLGRLSKIFAATYTALTTERLFQTKIVLQASVHKPSMSDHLPRRMICDRENGRLDSVGSAHHDHPLSGQPKTGAQPLVLPRDGEQSCHP